MLDFDWFFYIAKAHLNYTKEEFLESCPKEISALWEAHVKFNGWKFKEDNNNDFNEDRVYSIDEIPWL